MLKKDVGYMRCGLPRSTWLRACVLSAGVGEGCVLPPIAVSSLSLYVALALSGLLTVVVSFRLPTLGVARMMRSRVVQLIQLKEVGVVATAQA